MNLKWTILLHLKCHIGPIFEIIIQIKMKFVKIEKITQIQRKVISTIFRGPTSTMPHSLYKILDCISLGIRAIKI